MCSSWAPYAAVQRRRKGPQGGSQGCEPVGCQSTDGLSDNPGAAARSRRAGCPETAVSRWPFSWLLLFGHAKRSDSLAGRRAIERHGCRAPKDDSLMDGGGRTASGTSGRERSLEQPSRATQEQLPSVLWCDRFSEVGRNPRSGFRRPIPGRRNSEKKEGVGR
jgi:hypothetical protein